MKELSPKRSARRLRIVAICFVLIGSAAVAGHIVLFLTIPIEGHLGSLGIGMVYGITALGTGLQLLRRSRSALLTYIFWWISVYLYVLIVPGLLSAHVLPGAVMTAPLLWLLYRYMSRRLPSA